MCSPEGDACMNECASAAFDVKLWLFLSCSSFVSWGGGREPKRWKVSEGHWDLLGLVAWVPVRRDWWARALSPDQNLSRFLRLIISLLRRGGTWVPYPANLSWWFSFSAGAETMADDHRRDLENKGGTLADWNVMLSGGLAPGDSAWVL